MEIFNWGQAIYCTLWVVAIGAFWFRACLYMHEDRPGMAILFGSPVVATFLGLVFYVAGSIKL